MLPVMVTDMGAGRHPRRGRSLEMLAGRRLEYVRLGHAFVLSFAGGGQVLAETAIQLATPGAGRIVAEPGDHPSDALATLLGDEVVAARTGDVGELLLTFTSGAELLICPHADVESWAVTSPDGFLIVCLAGGETATWGEQ
ncbi:hypothetical protein Aab01nite_65680 [Paractinoplanes abujensis]|uniref:Uncharacterized protein n=1 Tax=Paractinoplanes abujensis TaxID=882441 RepID=A0A7W7CSF8_9ACTN|nr:DUF6188 family protein [Actinoplanes abujensis]MBB4692525.1 hypothetical protein [Actinoplanes abujensis]GID22978.1 hypothetical protein Aab01nite_65680 [Actinoplanes abujensis]